MTVLLAADPGQVRRAASALDTVADQAAGLGRQLVRQRPPCWRSPSSRDYVAQLHQLGQRVERVVSSHTSAAEVLAAYARTLEEAQEWARHAEALHQEGARRSAEWTARAAIGPDPGWALQSAAARTRREAADLERAAGARAAARLRELAAAAPEQSLASKVLRPMEDVVVTTVSGLRDAPAGLASLGGAAWSAVPFVHGAQEQREGRAALADAAKVWEAWLEAGRDAAAGRPGLAAGALVPLLVTRQPRRIKSGGDQGFLDGIDEGRLTINDVDEAWEQAHAAKALQDRIVALRAVPLPGVQALLAGEADLAHHEARGGHTILKHVGKRIEVLQARLELEAPGEPLAQRSTFPDLATAQELVRRALLANRPKIHSLVDGPKATSRTLKFPLDEPVGTVLRQDGSVVPGRSVVVVLRKKGGEVFIETAWVEA